MFSDSFYNHLERAEYKENNKVFSLLAPVECSEKAFSFSAIFPWIEESSSVCDTIVYHQGAWYKHRHISW